MKMVLHIFTLLSIVGSIFYVGLMAYAWIMADRLIFPETESSDQDGSNYFKLQASDGEEITACFLEAKNSKQLLLYCHGNGEDLGQINWLLKTFQARGISVLAFDYPGYGTSTGAPSEAGCYSSAEATYLYAVKTLGYTPEQICLYGRSLGGGPACWLAQRYPVGRMILEGTFTSIFRIVTKRRLLPWDKFNNLDRLKEITCPILFIHGSHDDTIPFSHAQKNYHAYQGEKKIFRVEDGGHCNLYEIAGEPLWKSVLDFILSQRKPL